ncbi:MAG: DNA-processing protein DprA [Spirochaetia bacterium]|jgi:DNA processing protein|nr:DNA-processing protein DprA [Spirochaetales bacterium]MDX9783920.1 DNA-processing protein DprA [Spirochaetia bacterium]
MKQWKNPRILALFQDSCLDPQPRAPGGKTGLQTLAIARMDFLRSHEKLLLSRAVDALEALAALELRELEGIILRSLNSEVWNPAACIERARRDEEFLERRGVVFMKAEDPGYPPQLRETYRPPFGLYVRGRLPDPSKPCIALVGTRAATGRGLRAAFCLAEELSAKGIPVVSGLALGIDSAAHRGALSGRAKTLAVLPGGMDSVYPASNRSLAARILDEGGCLVTENPPETQIRRYRFPERNRIIAGLARSCVVVEAPEGSGALITAEHALSEGRDVFVHRACLGGSRNSGCAALLEQGAIAVAKACDVFAEWASCGGRSPAFATVGRKEDQKEEMKLHG